MKLEVINQKLTDRMILPTHYWYKPRPLLFVNLFVSLNELSNVKLFEEGIHFLSQHFLSQRGVELRRSLPLTIKHKDHET